ncbi:hypothetical protein [Acaryochloris sp. IP29b_bin.148]|uniref:hypothetical protein n=1 Tax=Acaryochloris sp. IP29b_bin.148 TaxID=2969218 RepID=UPI002623BF2D|nr:hypothetical protein [Acaryochloris sp. IP29b_bin.148]
MARNFINQWAQAFKSDWNPQQSDVAVQSKWTRSTQTVYATSLNRDHTKIVRSADSRSPAAQEPNDTPSLSELLALSSHRLITVVQLSPFLPIYVKQAWIRQIRVMGLKRWQTSLAILEELYFDHRCAQTDYQPGRDPFDATVSNHQAFNAEMACIEYELNTMEMILKYAEACAQEA